MDTITVAGPVHYRSHTSRRARPLRSIVIVFALLVAVATFAEEDWQYWSTWFASHSLTEKSAVSALAEVYFRKDMSDDYVYSEYITYSRQFDRGFGMICQAYFESVETADGDWVGTRFLVAGPTYTVDIPIVGKLKLEDRCYYRINSPAGWDYHRPRVYLSCAVGNVTLMLSNELRLDLSGERPHDFYRNRLYATVFWKMAETLTLGVGYVRQSDRVADGGWSSFNGVQTLVGVTF